MNEWKNPDIKFYLRSEEKEAFVAGRRMGTLAAARMVHDINNLFNLMDRQHRTYKPFWRLPAVLDAPLHFPAGRGHNAFIPECVYEGLTDWR